jgi:hypothetical protein
MSMLLYKTTWKFHVWVMLQPKIESVSGVQHVLVVFSYVIGGRHVLVLCRVSDMEILCLWLVFQL